MSIGTLVHGLPMLDAGRVANDQRWALPLHGLFHNLDGMIEVSHHVDRTNVDIAVLLRDHAQVLLGNTLATSRETGDCAKWCGLAALSTSIAVNLSIHHYYGEI